MTAAIERAIGVKLIYKASKSLTYVTLKNEKRHIREYANTIIDRAPCFDTTPIREKYIKQKITEMALICLKTLSCSLNKLNFHPLEKTF
jgi:hypothetical protein